MPPSGLIWLFHLRMTWLKRATHWTVGACLGHRLSCFSYETAPAGGAERPRGVEPLYTWFVATRSSDKPKAQVSF